MTRRSYVPQVEDDQRHQPGPNPLRYWNESFWFPLYDPEREIGVIFRSGAFPACGDGEANLFLSILQEGRIVFSLSDQRAPLAPMEPGRLVMDNGLRIEWEEPLRSFRLSFEQGAHAFDLRWEGISPPFLYPPRPGLSVEQAPWHIEQGGRATGTVRIAGRDYELNAFAHRDHTFGGDRDWEKFYRWNYLSGELDDDFWFNAVRIQFNGRETPWIHVGCLWDGKELLDLKDVSMNVETNEAGTEATGVDVTITDETGRSHHIVSDAVLGVAPFRIWNTWLKDFVVRYRCGDRLGYGILEHGYLEERGS